MEIIKELKALISVVEDAISKPTDLSKTKRAFSEINTLLGRLLSSECIKDQAVFAILHTVRLDISNVPNIELVRIKTVAIALVELLKE